MIFNDTVGIQMIYCLLKKTTEQFQLIKTHKGPASAVVWKKLYHLI